MKHYFIILNLVCCCIVLGCHRKSIVLNFKTTECENFESFISKVWKFDSSTSTYYFEGNPAYWYDTIFFKPSCLIGKNKEEIVSIFGKPSKVFTFIDFEYFTYCIDKSCLQSVRSDGKQILFFVDSTDVVTQAIISPPMQKRNQNE